MRREAEVHAEEDRQRKELIETRNEADNLAYAAEKTLKDLGDKVPADLKSEVEAKVSEVRQKVQAEDVAEMKGATQALRQLVQKIGASVYQDQPQATPEGAPDSDGQSEHGPEVVDGEVKE